MASFNNTSRQKELVSVLYSVHENLRKQYRLVNNNNQRNNVDEDSNKIIWNEKWKEHVENTTQLQEYSKAMLELATEIWNPRHSSSSSFTTTTTLSKNISLANNKEEHPVENEEEIKIISINCRIEWVYLKCLNYFFSNTEKIKNIFQSTHYKNSSSNYDSDKKLKLLDVGSCFNPFEKYQNIFEITAIDLCPAPGFEKTVYKCDFLQVPLVSTSTSSSCCSIKDKDYMIMESLPKNYFDVVVFSFFLEYLPDPKQRLESCKKARDILKNDGILFILKPDSNPVTQTNMSFIKKIKVGMALLGFRRIYFEKLKHVWCTAYIKLEESEILPFINSSRVQNDLTKINSSNRGTLEHYELFVISQDLKHIHIIEDEEENQIESTNNNAAHDAFLFDELPLCIQE